MVVSERSEREANGPVYVVIERQHSTDLAVEYPGLIEAEHALDNSLFIDGLCEEDCLDIYLSATIPEDTEHILPPDE